MEAQVCDTCHYYLGPKKLPDGVPVPAGYNPRGQCLRFPTPVQKSPENWCGEWAAREVVKDPK